MGGYFYWEDAGRCLGITLAFPFTGICNGCANPDAKEGYTTLALCSCAFNESPPNKYKMTLAVDVWTCPCAVGSNRTVAEVMVPRPLCSPAASCSTEHMKRTQLGSKFLLVLSPAFDTALASLCVD